MLFFWCCAILNLMLLFVCKNFRLFLEKAKFHHWEWRISTLGVQICLLLVQTELTGVELFLLSMMFFVWVPVIMVMSHLNKNCLAVSLLTIQTVFSFGLWCSTLWQNTNFFFIFFGSWSKLFLMHLIECFINCSNFLPIWILGEHCQGVLGH